MTKPIAQVLEDIAAHGVRLVEMHGDAPDIHIDLTDEPAIDALATTVEDLPLRIHSLHCAFSQPDEETWDISQPDNNLRAKAVDRRRRVIASCARLGARHVVIHMGVRDRSRERFTHSLDSLHKLADCARDLGVKLAVENLPPDHLCGTLAEMALVMKEADPDVVGFCLDTGHAMLGDHEPSDLVRAFGDRLIAIHWHSNDGIRDSHLFPGTDCTDWTHLYQALDDVGYSLPVTVESVPPSGILLSDATAEAEAAMREKRPPRLQQRGAPLAPDAR